MELDNQVLQITDQQLLNLIRFLKACTGTNQPSAVSDRLQTKAAEAPRVLYYNCTRRYFSFL
jgi:hypothetical protein